MPTAEVRTTDRPVVDGASLAHTARLNPRTPITTWRLSRHRLLIEPECGEAQHVELAAVTMMCIRKAPSAWDMKRYRCDLATSDVRTFALKVVVTDSTPPQAECRSDMQ